MKNICVCRKRTGNGPKALYSASLMIKRPGVQHFDNRPIINIKQMLESSAELYGDGIAFIPNLKRGHTQQSRTEKCLMMSTVWVPPL